jgi:hypothetical protein
MTKAVRAQATSKNGDQLTVHAHESDAFLLPVAQLEQLHEFRPDLVDMVIEETRLEASYRRAEARKVNWFIFLERVFGQIGALLVASLGIGGGIYLGLHGQPVLGGTIATVTIGTLAVAFLTRSANSAKEPSPKRKGD